VVDDFGIKYVDTNDVLHLKNILLQHYPVSEDWTGSIYCGITLTWDYSKRTADLTMPGYVAAVLHRFQHPTPPHPEHSPHRMNPPTYGQRLPTEPVSTPLDPTGIKCLQSLIGALLFYCRAIDNTLFVALSSLASAQATATNITAKDAIRLLNYCNTHPDAVLRYVASDMILHVHGDGSYLSEKYARSRAGAHLWLANHPNPSKEVLNNGSLLDLAALIKAVMSSAAECEFGSLFLACKAATTIRTTLIEMGHPQPPTPVQVDNSTACSIANKTCKQIRSKAFDMRFYWVQDRIQQGHFHVYWAPGALNLADYHTKHHPVAHHIKMRPTYLHTATSPTHHSNTFVPLNNSSSARVC